MINNLLYYVPKYQQSLKLLQQTMLSNLYNNSTLLTPLPTQKVATFQISSTKMISIWQASLSKINNHFWKVQVKWTNYSVLPIPHIMQSPQLP